LARLRGGDDEALDRLVPMLYDELRGLARRLLGNERLDHTLTPTALVHEAYLRLSNERRIGVADRGEFFAVAATAMRRILVDSARRRNRAKRGGDGERVALDAVDSWMSDDEADELLALDVALEILGEGSPRARQVVELRIFAGLTLEETAVALAVNEKTVRRDWQLARAWLRRELGVVQLPPS
jgi:RNA polymerase sigma factor (TIGR02999 family)